MSVFLSDPVFKKAFSCIVVNKESHKNKTYNLTIHGDKIALSTHLQSLKYIVGQL